MSEALVTKLAELSARFRERSMRDREVIADSLARGDRPALAETAHKLAGNAGMFGHSEIGLAALELEEAAEGGADVTGPAERLLTLLAAL